jgi:hypothetical protein
MVIVAGALTGNSKCRRPADLNKAERDLYLSLNGRNNCRLTVNAFVRSCGAQHSHPYYPNIHHRPAH